MEVFELGQYFLTYWFLIHPLTLFISSYNAYNDSYGRQGPPPMNSGQRGPPPPRQYNPQDTYYGSYDPMATNRPAAPTQSYGTQPQSYQQNYNYGAPPPSQNYGQQHQYGQVSIYHLESIDFRRFRTAARTTIIKVTVALPVQAMESALRASISPRTRQVPTIWKHV